MCVWRLNLPDLANRGLCDQEKSWNAFFEFPPGEPYLCFEAGNDPNSIFGQGILPIPQMNVRSHSFVDLRISSVTDPLARPGVGLGQKRVVRCYRWTPAAPDAVDVGTRQGTPSPPSGPPSRGERTSYEVGENPVSEPGQFAPVHEATHRKG